MLLQVLILFAALLALPSTRATISTAVLVKKAPASTSNDGKKQFINFIAGGLAGTISSVIVQPLEVIKTQLQSSVSSRLIDTMSKRTTPLTIARKILETDGPKGFYRGLKPLVVGIIPTRGIYFWSYNSAKTFMNSTLGMSTTSPLTHLASAFAAGITSNTLTNPLWLVKTRFQLLADTSVGQTAYRTYGEVVRSIYAEEGLGGFFKGLSGSYVGCFEGGIQWIVYEKLKASLSSTKTVSVRTNPKNGAQETTIIVRKRTPSALEYSVAASTAKLAAILATYPHEVVRTRLREQAVNGNFKYRGFVNTLSTIAREEGARGLYGGMGLHILRSVPNAAIMFVSFELCSKFLNENF